MRFVETITAFALLVPAVSCVAQSMPSTDKSPPKVGVFTFSGGFKHGSLELAEKTIRELGEKSAAFEAVLHQQYKQSPEQLDLALINAEYLKQFAAVLFYTTSGPKDLDILTPPQREALMNAIKGGVAFVGVHSATDTFYKWPEYGEMIGGYFDGHPWGADSAPVTIKIEDQNHPATYALGPSWFVQEEIYQFKAPYDRAKLHVLMSLDTTATDMTLAGINRTDGDFALAWAKYHGKGRVYYTALGHRDDVWQSELFQKHLLGGIRWALGQVDGRPSPPGAPEQKLTTVEGGVEFVDLTIGPGQAVKRFDKLLVHYTGWLMDGEKFASSRDDDKPIEFTTGMGGVVRGWDEGVIGMKVGGKRKLYIPPGMGYGARGSPPRIPPNAKLVFEIEVLAIK